MSQCYILSELYVSVWFFKVIHLIICSHKHKIWDYYRIQKASNTQRVSYHTHKQVNINEHTQREYKYNKLNKLNLTQFTSFYHLFHNINCPKDLITKLHSTHTVLLYTSRNVSAIYSIFSFGQTWDSRQIKRKIPTIDFCPTLVTCYCYQCH